MMHIIKKVTKWGREKTDNVIYRQPLDRKILHNLKQEDCKCALFLSNFISSRTYLSNLRIRRMEGTLLH